MCNNHKEKQSRAFIAIYPENDYIGVDSPLSSNTSSIVDVWYARLRNEAAWKVVNSRAQDASIRREGMTPRGRLRSSTRQDEGMKEYTRGGAMHSEER